MQDFADVADIDVHHRHGGVRIKAPDPVENLLFGKNGVFVADQVFEHVKLLPGEGKLPVSDFGRPVAQVQGKPPEGEGIFL
ncbi:hypothetical protein SDC9_210510 [bioreactor metagenome]|uniref:Uncharacterized protein n=1 Tax=bioreactor metagenome TaxID=1076179 RepID=A0A645JHD8_9ZZZZ